MPAPAWCPRHELELVGEHTHLGDVDALELDLAVGRMPPFMTLFWILKKA